MCEFDIANCPLRVNIFDAFKDTLKIS